MKVGIEKTDPAGGQPTLALVPAQRPILIQDLMRHTSGLTYGFFGNLLVKKAYVDAGITKGDFDNAEFADRLAKLPLAFQPGTTWDYSHSTDILDTSFYVTDGSKQNRIAEPFKADRVLGAAAEMNNPRIVGKWESGGGGMCGTTTDYARFLRMLLSGGILDGKRYLGPKTISYMTADHMGNVIVPVPIICQGRVTASAWALRSARSRASLRPWAALGIITGAASAAPTSGSIRGRTCSSCS